MCSFIFNLFKPSVFQIISLEWQDDKWKERERNSPLPILRYYPGICVVGVSKASVINGQLNTVRPEYEAEMLTIRELLRSVVN
jgi:hypothetical protein